MTLTMNGISTSANSRPRIECIITAPFASPASQTLIPVTATWTLNNYARAGTFSADFALSGAQAVGAWYDAPDAMAGKVNKIDFQIIPSYLDDTQDPSSTRSSTANVQFQGLVDKLTFDPISNSLSVGGRDYSVLLLDYEVDDVYLNLTSSEIAQKLAGAIGLSANVARTKNPAGRFFSVSHTHHSKKGHSRFRNAWELLSKLASYEQYDLWVQGTTLNFQPMLSNSTSILAQMQQPAGSGAYATANFETARLERDLIIAKGVRVEISSWDSAQRVANVGKWPLTGSANATVYSPAVAPNLSQGKVQAMALSIYNDILAHLRTVTITVPGDLTMEPRQSLQFAGSNTTWDRPYRIDNIEREMSAETGFHQTVTARTRDPSGDAS